jgi:hypothetical protein
MAALRLKRYQFSEEDEADRSGSHDLTAGRCLSLPRSVVWTARGVCLRPLWQALLRGAHPASGSGTTPGTR